MQMNAENAQTEAQLNKLIEIAQMHADDLALKDKTVAEVYITAHPKGGWAAHVVTPATREFFNGVIADGRQVRLISTYDGRVS